MNLRSRQSTRGARFMVGLMSGTSADGIDAVVAELSGGGRRLRARVRTSGRRWEQRGVWRTIVLMWRLRWAYWRGVPAERLAEAYR